MLAKMWGIDTAKILRWIRGGQLRAIDASGPSSSRPRYLIDLADIAEFERRRAAVPEPKSTRRRIRASGVTEYF